MGYNIYDIHTNTSIPYQSTITFVPNETTSQLESYMIFHFDQNLSVYDGGRVNDSILLSFKSGWGYSNESAVTLNNALTVVTSGIVMNDGFRLSVQKQGECPSVSNIVTSAVNDSVYLTWTDNGVATQWQVEYGPSGFMHGDGTLITVSDTMANIGGLVYLTQYDFSIRPICNPDVYGTWKTVPITSGAPYWSDVVLVEPAGYSLELDGTVSISSAEGFTWWAKTGCVYSAKLTSDIDLGGYKWLPVENLNNKLDGQGHKIINLYAKEESSSLFIDVQDTICNLGLENVTVISTMNDAGALCYGLSSTGTIYNCYVVNGYVEGGSTVGGMVGNVAGGEIVNCYAEATVVGRSINAWKGIIAGQTYFDGEILNCYAICPVSMRNFWNMGSIVGFTSNATVSHCFCTQTANGFIGQQGPSVIIDTSTFSGEGTDWTLNTPIVFDNEQVTDLCMALNKSVKEFNNGVLRLWSPDSNYVNDGFPILGDIYPIICPNVEDITIHNIKVGDSVAVVINWTENENVEQWQIKYKKHDADNSEAVIINTNHNPDTLYGIPATFEYDFYIRAICNQIESSGWSAPISFIVDLPYWTEIITSQPEGYENDGVGNITIYSAEGLAWLSAISNGIVEYQNIQNVTLMNDVDISGYRWLPISTVCFHPPVEEDRLFKGNFNGNGHKITGMYINMKDYSSGLFGYFGGDSLHNVILDGGWVVNHTFSSDASVSSGGLVGFLDGNLNNCHSSVNVSGYSYIGGLCGVVGYRRDSISVLNCSAKGIVTAQRSCGGLLGGINDNVFVRNCFSTGDVLLMEDVDESGQFYFGGFLGSCGQSRISNCYSSGNVEYVLIPNLLLSTGVGNVIGCTKPTAKINNLYGLANDGFLEFAGYAEYDYRDNPDCIQDTSYFSQNGNVCTLTNEITIEDSTYSDLVDVLNAWVNANDTAGIYRHWAADTTGENGGFPVFAAIPCLPVVGSDSITACDSYTWRGNIYTASTTLIDTLTTLNGCDSIVTHHIIVNHPVHASTTDAACGSYVWNGTDYTVSGDYTYSHADANGCTQVDTLHLTVNHPIHIATTEVACNGYTWNGADYTVSGDYTYSHVDANGCMQVDTLHLTINYAGISRERATACDSYTWKWTTYTQSGEYTFDTLTISGCDSTITLELTVNHSTSSVFTVRACDEYTWHRYTYTESTDEPTYTMVGSNECDSVVNLHLTINHSSSGVETVTACNSYVWHEREYSESTDTATFYMPNGNAVGCDSMVTLNLTINHCSTTTLAVCDSYTWTSGTGLTYYESGEYVSGDDTLVLTVNHPVHSATTEAACDSYTWNGTDYTTSGDYTSSHADVNGCTQVDTLHLTINQSVHTSATETECDTYSWNGTTFNASGDYTYGHADANGCTQVDTLHLTINHSAETVVTDSAENSYTWNGVTYTESGTYTWVGLTAEGCDSTVTLHLTVVASQEGIDEADATAARIYAVGSRIVVDGAEGNPVYLYNAIGQLIKSQRKEEDGVMVIEAPAAGVYMVKVGAYPARKVVVIR